MSKLLIDDKPVMVLPKLACVIGLNEAIVLQQVHYWLETYRTAGSDSHFRDGSWWVYNTKVEWQENFPWWSDNTVWRALVKLRDLGLLKTTSAYNQKGYDRTLWYTIDYDALAKLEKSILPNWVNALSQNGKMDLPNLVSPIPETISENNAEIVPQKSKPRKEAHSQPTVGANAPAHAAPSRRRSEPAPELLPSSQEERVLFGLLHEAAQAQGRNGPKRFANPEQARAFRDAVQVLNGKTADILRTFMRGGGGPLGGAVAYVAGAARKEREAQAEKQRMLTPGAPGEYMSADDFFQA